MDAADPRAGRVSIRVASGLPDGIDRLVGLGRGEGFAFVERLVREWRSGENRFAGPGEVFLAAYLGGSLVGFGGLNRDPFCGEPGVGRLRHLYVGPDARGLGVGAALVRELVGRAHPAFARLRLATRQAAPFYEHLGFVPVEEERATHALVLDERAGP
jgi:GNAT superfamily N-acetyltransferase